jgi:hypothetical protein
MLDNCDPTREIGAAWGVKAREHVGSRSPLSPVYLGSLAASLVDARATAGVHRHKHGRKLVDLVISHSRCPAGDVVFDGSEPPAIHPERGR